MKRLQDRYNIAISASEITYSQKKYILKFCFYSSIYRNNFYLKRNEDRIDVIFNIIFIKSSLDLNFGEHDFHIQSLLRQI